MREWFWFEGRLSRSEFFFSLVGIVLLAFVGGLLVEPLPLLALVILLPTVWLSWMIYIKRLHDMGRSRWLVLLVLIPLVNVGMFLWLLFAKGKRHSSLPTI